MAVANETTVSPQALAAAGGSNQSLTTVLAEFGIRHEAQDAGRTGSRYLFTEDGCIGVADVVEGWRLARLLQRLARATGAA